MRELCEPFDDIANVLRGTVLFNIPLLATILDYLIEAIWVLMGCDQQ